MSDRADRAELTALIAADGAALIASPPARAT